tara:strand:- start:752 stop:1438 length:687 start_codon:yes stop_codon:yes gene_type:complete
MDRDTRKIQNTKQPSMEFIGKPSLNNMLEGQFAVEKQSNSQLAIFRKKFGQLWKSYMSNNGDQYVDRTLTTNTLKYTNKFIDYRVFIHNFAKDLDTDETFLPWAGTTEVTTTRCDVGYLTPFKMTCVKLLFKVPVFDDNTDDIVFKIKKMDDGDASVDEICNFTYDTSSLGNTVDNTILTINESDWNNTPTIESNDVALISIDAADTGITTGAREFFVTSIWRVEVVV